VTPASIKEIREIIKKELPDLMRQDPEIQHMVLRLARQEFADRHETEDRFTLLLKELRRDREEQSRKWDEQQLELKREWNEQNSKWQEQSRRWDEQNSKWQEQTRMWHEQREEQNCRWDEQNRKWDENQKQLVRLHEEIMAIALKHDRSIGALGARWGISSEAAFRNALAAILEQSFNARVINIQDYDDEGQVFGRPDQVELDVIILDGMVIAIEMKSSMSKADMYLFERKVRFYENRHQRKVNRLMVISPMIDARARKAGEALAIEMYSDSMDVESL